MSKAIIMADNDNVATALQHIPESCVVELIDKQGKRHAPVVAKEAIPAGNKIALQSLAVGMPMIKYGVAVGEVMKPVSAGEFVHVHNVKSNRIDIPDPIISEILRQMNYEPKQD